jgi:glycosyltransferase involved in cell wall biosynthesis
VQGETFRTVVIVPCRNEAATVGKVVRDFLSQPSVSEVFVVDNASTDETAELARAAGARVIRESRPGKGFALLSGLRAAGQADYCVMVDGDDTYPAAALGALLEKARAGADMVIATRLEDNIDGSFRPGHGFGNRLFILLVRLLFGLRTTDLFSGYRVLSRRYLDRAPLLATGFEVELELSLQALTNSFVLAELPVRYGARPTGSVSKLHTYRDGLRILRALFLFFRDYRPLAFFGLLGGAAWTGSLVIGTRVVLDYMRTGLVPRVPSAVLAAALFLLGALAWTCGVLLSSINRRTSELAALVNSTRVQR